MEWRAVAGIVRLDRPSRSCGWRQHHGRGQGSQWSVEHGGEGGDQVPPGETWFREGDQTRRGRRQHCDVEELFSWWSHAVSSRARDRCSTRIYGHAFWCAISPTPARALPPVP